MQAGSAQQPPLSLLTARPAVSNVQQQQQQQQRMTGQSPPGHPLQLCHTAIIKLKSAWFCALSKIFHVKGSDVDFISEMCEHVLRLRLLIGKTGSVES